MLRSRQDLADYCLRALGGGVINIEVSDEQIEDRLQDALDYYHEYHFEGIERDYIRHKVDETTLTLASTTGLAVGNILTGSTSNASATVTGISGLNVTVTKVKSLDKWAQGETVTSSAFSSTITTVSLGILDTGYFSVDDTVFSVIKVINLSSVINSADYMYNMQYQIMMNEITSLTSGQTSYLFGVMQHLAELEMVLRKEKDFRYNRRMDKIFLDINWDSDVKVGDWIVCEVYRIVDDAVYKDVFNDIWLKRYATALIKRQWGANLSKYENVTLPGGIVYSGTKLFQEAQAEIEKLEREAIDASSPPMFMVG